MHAGFGTLFWVGWTGGSHDLEVMEALAVCGEQAVELAARGCASRGGKGVCVVGWLVAVLQFARRESVCFRPLILGRLDGQLGSHHPDVCMFAEGVWGALVVGLSVSGMALA